VERLLNGRIDRLWRFLALVIVLFIAGLFYDDWRQFQVVSTELDRTGQIQRQTDILLSTITDAETGQRGYLLTGDPIYLDPYKSALRDLPGELKTLAAAAAADKGAAADVARLQTLIQEKLAELERAIAMRDEYGPADALAVFRNDAGLLTMNEIRSTCKELLVSERLRSYDLGRSSRSRGSSVLIVVLAGCLGLIVLLWYLGNAVDSVVKEREASTRSIEESRQQLQTTLASIGDAVIVTDAAGAVRFMNPVAATLTGWTADAAAKKPLADVFRIVDEKTHRTIDKNDADGAAAHRVLVAHDDTEIPIEDTSSPIRTAAGKILGQVLVFRDITARRIAERELERWKQIFSDAGFGMFVADSRDGVLIDMNPTFAAMHGYSVSELLGRSLQVLVPADSAAELAASLRIAGQKGRHMFEGQHIRHDGTDFPSLVDVTTFHDGRSQLLAGYCSDITERRRFEDALRESEERFRTLASALPQPVWSTAADGSIEYVNQEWISYAGWQSGNDAGKYLPLYPWKDLLHSEDRDDYHARWRDSLLTGATFESQARLRRFSDGAWRWFLCRAVPVRDRTGKIVRWLGGCTDIQHQMEAARQLQLANQALQQSNADLEQFAYAASHDLQEPLRMVSIYSELLKEEYGDSLDPNARSYIDFAVNGARRMSQLLKDLLMYSRVSNGSPGKSPAADAHAAVSSALLNLATVIDSSRADVEIGSLPTVDIPEIHLVQLFQNLIGNALKYSKEGERPFIRIGARPDAGGGWIFSVRDNGIGIEPEYLQQIFGIFRRLHGTAYEGTGIGLALCQKIVERAGGRIWAESEPGKGSTFFFTLQGAEGTNNELACQNTAGRG
jgi:PAS domain S-box-containing protein